MNKKEQIRAWALSIFMNILKEHTKDVSKIDLSQYESALNELEYYIKNGFKKK